MLNVQTFVQSSHLHLVECVAADALQYEMVDNKEMLQLDQIGENLILGNLGVSKTLDLKVGPE